MSQDKKTREKNFNSKRLFDQGELVLIHLLKAHNSQNLPSNLFHQIHLPFPVNLESLTLQTFLPFAKVISIPETFAISSEIKLFPSLPLSFLSPN
jgi:hypothetical protein